MAEDHLDSEVSASAELTETGVKAGAKSRAVASVDRLIGAVVDIGNAHLEGFAERKRAKTKGEISLIDAVAQYGVERLGASPEIAERAISKHFRKVFAQQENIDAVVEQAKIDLIEGSQDYEDVSGQMSDEFFDRFENYSASASTDELRQRWGRVLASEIRKPGTFSSKVLRVVDEMDAETARLFERVCQFRVDGTIYKDLLGELDVQERASLVTAGLMIDPGVGGHGALLSQAKFNDGVTYYIAGSLAVGGLRFAIPTEEFNNSHKLREIVPATKAGAPAVQVFLLTDVGQAISTILPDNSRSVVSRYASLLAGHLKSQQVLLMTMTPELKIVGYGVAKPL